MTPAGNCAFQGQTWKRVMWNVYDNQPCLELENHFQFLAKWFWEVKDIVYL